MGKLRPGQVEWLAPGHTGRPRPSQSLLLLLWTLLNCVLGSGAQGPGEWTPWGSWSRCSSSCGRGVSVRSRRCIRFPGEESCSGISHEYRLCQLPDCPPGAVPFRDIQCALYNGRPVLGTQKTYQWIPFHGAPNQCDLNCLAEGHAFYHSFGRVLDGTPCSPGAHGLCVAGRCLSAGCDGVLGSGALEDRCGRCGGANDSCLFVQRVFRDAGAFAGYWNVTLIPEGARHIRVAHRSRNHLALMGVDGRYVLNGNWEVSPPGTYEAAGTRVVYARAAAPEETLRATGPTSQDLLLQILLQEPNPGIQFEFWLPRERYGPFQLQTQARGWPVRQRQPQLREVEPRPLEGPTAPPALIPTLAPDPCPPCPDTRGRAHRLLHYCGSDFVFQARVLGRHRQAQETRYEVRIQLIYKNRGPLRSQEYVWAPGHCPCPPLAPHQEYLLAIRRLLSPDGTQDRLLLPHAGYARPWSPAEDSRIRLAARRCPP
ncbi:ADAMTS-like protein 5 isoform X5 [Sciurus carolinensis]|uniref:ADAMTS-like protein 5 isoform X5 n=1 Tax=Sciurus carolinensis TaxID=30640 RepID=UPI001FB442BE|nr:ADAMTS-like protein 5 isoform X5 [Sciurus carolinensis]